MYLVELFVYLMFLAFNSLDWKSGSRISDPSVATQSFLKCRKLNAFASVDKIYMELNFLHDILVNFS